MATTDTDVLLVRQVRAGDAHAWEHLIDRFEGRLLAFVQGRLRDARPAKTSCRRRSSGS